MRTTRTEQKLKITVKRPGGAIETVIKTDNVVFLGKNKIAQKQVIDATKAAGKGDVLSFEIIEEQIPLTLEEQRQDLVYTIGGLIDAQDAAIERDYNRDIGFHESAKFDSKINVAREELAKFDEAHPHIIAEINRLEAIRTEQLIQSALNA